MLFCTATDAVLHNVAVNRRSYQVSTYTDQFRTYTADLANDGSRQISYGCARSQTEIYPWWAVDLGVETLVAQVSLTNRGDAAGAYIHLRVSMLRETYGRLVRIK